MTAPAGGPARRRWRPPMLLIGLIVSLVMVGASLSVLSNPGRGVTFAERSHRAGSAPERGGGGALSSGACDFWVSPRGDDDWPGSRAEPWATLTHAAEEVPDQGCTVWFVAGTYEGPHNIKRRFTRTTTFRSEPEQRAVLEHDGTVLDIDGGRNIVIEGFELRHTSDDTPRSAYVAIVDRADDTWSEHITFRDNVFHDSHGDDLLKIHNGVRHATVEGNVFYNQGENEQQIDINSVTDVVVQDNVFFDDYAASDRSVDTPPKHFVVVKDSNEDDDGLEGSERITIRRNVMLSWEGSDESFVQVGNDGKPYHEATGVLVENNLLIGNAPTPMGAAFGVRGARDVTFNHNTVTGDLPGKAYAYRVSLTGDNPVNDDIVFTNNVWSDPTGTMGATDADQDPGRRRFADVDPDDVTGLRNVSNLYWNGGAALPPAAGTAPQAVDPGAVVADPGTARDLSGITPPVWTGDGFAGGFRTIREVFVSLVESYGAVPPGSSAVDAADAETAAAEDILGRPRTAPDLGAYEVTPGAGTEQVMAGDGR